MHISRLDYDFEVEDSELVVVVSESSSLHLERWQESVSGTGSGVKTLSLLGG